MSSLMIVGLSGTFLAVLSAVLVVGIHAADRRRAVHLLQASVGTVDQTADLREQALAPSLGSRVAGSLGSAIKPMTAKFVPTDMRSAIAWKLVQAGNPSGWDADKVLAVRFIGVFLVPFLAYNALNSASGLVPILGTAIGAYVGYAAPLILLDGRITRRRTSIQRALPDTIDLLTISVEAGLGFDAALAQVVKNVPGELSEEIARTLREMQLGLSRADAFRNFKDRTDVEELRAFTLAIIQADTFGISIAKVLRTQADTIRLKRRQRTEEQAMKVTVKILFPLIVCILPSLFIVVLGPGVMRIADAFS